MLTRSKDLPSYFWTYWNQGFLDQTKSSGNENRCDIQFTWDFFYLSIYWHNKLTIQNKMNSISNELLALNVGQLYSLKKASCVIFCYDYAFLWRDITTYNTIIIHELLTNRKLDRNCWLEMYGYVTCYDGIYHCTLNVSDGILEED